MKNYERIFFAAVFIIALVGLTGLIPKVVMAVLLIGMLVYLTAGWYLLRPGNRGAARYALPFGVSYLIAQTCITVLFGIRDWPMKEIFAFVTLVMTLVAVLLLLIYRKKPYNSYPVTEYIIRLVVCFMFAGSPLWIP